MIKKILITILIFCLSVNIILAANTYTTDLELDNTQYWSIIDINQTGLDIVTDFTFEFWIKLEQLPSVSGTVFGIIQKDDTGTNRAYLCNLHLTDKLRVLYFSNDSTYTFFDSTNAIVVSGDVGSWVHIAVSVDISAQTCEMYKNGSLVTDTVVAANATTIQNASSVFYIGGNTQFFDGLIDDVRIWDDIRSGQEISDHYNCSLDGDETNLQGYWRFDNDGTDSTANSNDLTNNNSATFQSASLPFTDSCTVSPPPSTGVFYEILNFN